MGCMPTGAARLIIIDLFSGTIYWQYLACTLLYIANSAKLILIEGYKITCIIPNSYTHLYAYTMHTQTGRLLLRIGHTYITQFLSHIIMHTGWYVNTCLLACVRAYVRTRERADARGSTCVSACLGV